MNLRHVLKRCIRASGYNLSRSHPDVSIEVFLTMLLRDFEIDCVLDVGANTGHYGRLLRGIGYRGWIISFEPRLAAFEKLGQLTARDQRWIVRRQALGTEEGSLVINVAGGDGGSSSFLPPSAFGLSLEATREVLEPAAMQQELVPMTTLTSVFEECVGHGPADRILLKTDTQGYDLEVLKGGELVLGRLIAVQSEVSFQHIYENSPDYITMFRFFNQHGFQLAALFPLFRDWTDRIVEGDCIMINAELGAAVRNA